MSGCQLVDTPLEVGLKLQLEPNKTNVKRGRYQQLVGRLMYLGQTWLDLTYALSVVSQNMHNLGEQHMNAIISMLIYLKSNLGRIIMFKKNSNYESVDTHIDSDWAS